VVPESPLARFTYASLPNKQIQNQGLAGFVTKL
jgi:hypothetical protein